MGRPASVNPPRIVFAGTPEFAEQILRALLEHTAYAISAVFTQPDRPAGRGRQLLHSPVKRLALERGLPVHQPASLRDPAARAGLAELQPDLLIVAAYGLILPAAVLSIPRLGCINVHASILPRWRGAAPIERAIEAGDHETGVTIMQMNEGLDTGALLLVRRCPIGAHDTGGTLRDRLGTLGAAALVEALEELFGGRSQALAQDDSLATYANKLHRDESLIDWHADAQTLERRVRAFNPLNVCHTTVANQVLRVWQASAETPSLGGAPGTVLQSGRDGILVACGKDALRLQRLQLAGGKVMDVPALLNGRGEWFRPGTVLGGATV